MTRQLGFSFLGMPFGLLLGGLSLAMVPQDSPSSDEKVLLQAHVDTDSDSLLAFFRKRTLKDKQHTRLAELIRKLGDDSFEEREKATSDLQQMGRLALAALSRAVKDSDPEIARRAEECLQSLRQGPELAATLAAIRFLSARKPPRALEVLLDYLPNAADSVVAEAVTEALGRLAVQDGKLDPALPAALGDQDPVRRAAAAELVARLSSEHRGAVRKLLVDAEVGVRYAAGVALTRIGEKSAVDTLLGLFKDAPAEQIWEVEEILFRVAGDQAVAASLSSGLDVENRRRCQEEWEKWWRINRDKADLAPLSQEEQELGVRVVCELQGGGGGGGRVLAYGPDNQVRWPFDNVAGPIDVQMQPNGRMLIAEINVNRVTERDQSGKVFWEKKTEASPMTSQRLSNGNVFIATYTELLEVTPQGQTVWSQKKPSAKIFCAQKLRNGHVLFVISGGLVIELDGQGKEVRSVPAGDTSNWGSVEQLHNGHFLVCRCGRHEVVEIDTDGKELWRCQAEWPTWACQQRNGRVLVACAHSGQVIEFDRDGKEMWKQKLGGRPCRLRRY